MRRFLRIRGGPSVQARAAAGPVAIEVDKTSWNSRRIFASIGVAAPVDMVWGALTDYANLHTFIPSLVENKLLERRGNIAVLYQVGAQDVAMGVKFSAMCTLSCEEFINGVPAALLSASADEMDSCFPMPPAFMKGSGVRDITFQLLEGDFQEFRGVWRMQPVGDGSRTLLSYWLYVRPQAWLPVGIIQGRIEREVVRNLEAVSGYAQSCWAQRGQQQLAQQAQQGQQQQQQQQKFQAAEGVA